MRPIEKLLRKITKEERAELLAISGLLAIGKTETFRIEKLAGTEFYKTRKGNFRIVFYFEGKAGVIVSIRRRNEKTYKNL